MNVLANLVKTRAILKDKLKNIKFGELERTNFLENTFQPISRPLNELVDKLRNNNVKNNADITYDNNDDGDDNHMSWDDKFLIAPPKLSKIDKAEVDLENEILKEFNPNPSQTKVNNNNKTKHKAKIYHPYKNSNKNKKNAEINLENEILNAFNKENEKKVDQAKPSINENDEEIFRDIESENEIINNGNESDFDEDEYSSNSRKPKIKKQVFKKTLNKSRFNFKRKIKKLKHMSNKTIDKIDGDRFIQNIYDINTSLVPIVREVGNNKIKENKRKVDDDDVPITSSKKVKKTG